MDGPGDQEECPGQSSLHVQPHRLPRRTTGRHKAGGVLREAGAYQRQLPQGYPEPDPVRSGIFLREAEEARKQERLDNSRKAGNRQCILLVHREQYS